MHCKLPKITHLSCRLAVHCLNIRKLEPAIADEHFISILAALNWPIASPMANTVGITKCMATIECFYIIIT